MLIHLLSFLGIEEVVLVIDNRVRDYSSTYVLILDGSTQVELIDSGSSIVYGNAMRVHSNIFRP